MTDKKKSSNFSGAEVGVVVDEVEMHKAVLFAKFGSNVSNSMKTKFWLHVKYTVSYRVVSYYALATLLPTSLRLCHR